MLANAKLLTPRLCHTETLMYPIHKLSMHSTNGAPSSEYPVLQVRALNLLCVLGFQFEASRFLVLFSACGQCSVRGLSISTG